MYQTLRPLLFRLDPERAHSLTLTVLRWAGQFPITNYLLHRLFDVSDPRLEVKAFGLRFKNPVGLAAGYDKNGVALRGLSALGFGHVEVGTITPRPQAGNPRPRVHRLPQVQGIINSMGFPNAGAEAIRADRWQAVRPNVRVGLNLGKGKDTPLERAAEDYIALLQRFHRQVDYFTINVSSPNTLGLRQLQTRTFIEDLLSSIAQARDALVPRVPLLVKIAPDLTESEIDAVLDASLAAGIDGLIATNTTVGRAGLPPDAAELKGGLSGQPLKARATAVIRYIAQCTAGRLPVIGVGGIASAADAIDKLQAGAWLVQVYTGLIYAGPSLAREINLGMLKCHET